MAEDADLKSVQCGFESHHSYMAKKIDPKTDSAVAAIKKRDGGDVYLNKDGTKTVKYPDGSQCHYPKPEGGK